MGKYLHFGFTFTFSKAFVGFPSGKFTSQTNKIISDYLNSSSRSCLIKCLRFAKEFYVLKYESGIYATSTTSKWALTVQVR